MANSRPGPRAKYGEKKRLALEFLDYLKQDAENKILQRSDLKDVYSKEFVPQSDTSPNLGFADVLHILTRMFWVKRSETDRSTLHVLNKKERMLHRKACAINKTKLQKSSAEDKPRSSRVALDQHLSVGKVSVEVLLLGLPAEGSECGQDGVRTDDTNLPDFIRATPKGRHQFVCLLCDAHCNSARLLTVHMNGRRHRVSVLTRSLKANKKFLIQDKNNVKITSSIIQNKDGVDPAEIQTDDQSQVVTEVQENKKQFVVFTIENCSATELLFFHRCEMLRRVRVFQLDDKNKVSEGKGAYGIGPGEKYDVTVQVCAKHIGSYAVPVAFMFSHESNPSEKTHIVRYVSAYCHNDLIRELQPKIPFKHPPRKSLKRPDLEEIDGLRMPKNTEASLKHEIELGTYRVPGGLRLALNQGLKETDSMNQAERKQIKDFRKRLAETLTMENHMEKMSLLLHIEEIQMEVDIRKYDMEAVTMAACKDNKRLLTLKVPGLLEKRPSVLRGDWLFARRHQPDGSLENKEYRGYVHNVQLNEVWLGFSSRLVESFISGQKFDIRFVFNRFPIRLQHRSAQLSRECSLDQVLFPSPETACKRGLIQDPKAALRFFDRKLESNNEQRRAVQHIVAGTSRPAPYLVFGPPGTGKTVTIVEAMKQIHKCIPTAHILACAPSNSAADLLATRLCQHLAAKTDVFRINADSRNPTTIPTSIQEICNYDKRTKEYFFPNKKELIKYRVIVTTMVTAGRIASANFPPGHFTHVFLDEAGHAMECEALIAVAGVLDVACTVQDGAQLVLAGDPKQLGPVLRSPIAKQQGLAVSLLERYMEQTSVYSRKDDAQSTDNYYDANLVTKLVRNYRSHPDIIHIPNVLFYDNDLQVFADKLVRESLCTWEELPKKGFPLVFHGIIGNDKREERSPSFFNPEEVAIVLKYVESLLSARKVKTTQKEIGIISPYRKQVQKIKKVLRDRKLNDITVGSVEEFQGEERKVIIISTVRSNSEYLTMDATYKLGFLRNPKRFNVAITRAKALVVVIGNPYVLSQDENWNSFLEYCVTKGGYTGCDYDHSSDQMEDIIQRFDAVNLNDLTEMEAGNVSAVEHVEEPAWKGET